MVFQSSTATREIIDREKLRKEGRKEGEKEGNIQEKIKAQKAILLDKSDLPYVMVFSLNLAGETTALTYCILLQICFSRFLHKS